MADSPKLYECRECHRVYLRAQMVRCLCRRWFCESCYGNWHLWKCQPKAEKE